MPAKKILILGDSQVYSFLHGLVDESFRESLRNEFSAKFIANGNIVLDFVMELAGGETVLNPLVSSQFSPTMKLAKTFWKDNHVAFMLGGVEHNRHALLAGGKEFGFYTSDDEDDEIDGFNSFVPLSMVTSFFENVYAKFDMGLALISKLAIHNGFYVLQSPPPASGVVSEYFTANFGTVNAVVGSIEFRMKIYEAASNVLEAITVRNGGTFVRSPAQARSSDGSLKPSMTADPYHANGEYGRLFLSELDERFSVRPPSQSLIAEPLDKSQRLEHFSNG